MKPHQDSIAGSVIALMRTCPVNAVATRKEVSDNDKEEVNGYVNFFNANPIALLRSQLLVATRHILATDFRAGFFKNADLLFSEKMLIGEHPRSSL